MTTPTTFATPYVLDCSRASAALLHKWSALGAAALLAGCASAPMPTWNPPARTPVQAPAASKEPASPILSSAQTSPVAANTALEALPYAAEVAARFPDPAVRYQTPGLENGRRSFTTNEELGAALQDISNKTLGQPARLGLVTLGSSQRGRPIHALVATKGAAINPDALDATSRPTVLMVAGQQGTDAAPTEALLVMAKELNTGGLLQPMLDQVNVILVPRANPDGFEAQTTATADGTVMTEDHLLLATPEARALAKLVRNYRPTVVINAQEFAAIHPTLEQFDALRAEDAGLQYGAAPNVHEFILKSEKEWLHTPITRSLTQAGQRVNWAYTAAATDKTLRMGPPTPASLHNVSALKNLPSLAVYSRGADLQRTHIQRRVHTQVTALTAALQDTIARAGDFSKVQSFVTRDVASQTCKGQLAIAAQTQQAQRDVVMLDPQTGADKSVHAGWVSAIDLRPSQQRPRPCGYWLSAQSDQAVERLRLLGVQVQRVAEQAPVLSDGYMAASGTHAQPTFTLVRNAVDAVPGSYYISMNQPLANVAAAALEPDTPYSYIQQGLIPALSDLARVMAPTTLVFEED